MSSSGSNYFSVGAIAMPAFRVAVGLLAGLLLMTPALAVQADAHELLARMNKAFVHENYDGVFTYVSGNELASLRVVHKVIDGVQRERLVHLDGAPREIMRHGDKVVCIVMPGDDIAALEDSIPSGPFARAFVRGFERLADVYSVAQMGEGRVANRRAVRIEISPRDEHRYGYRLWLDDQTSLLLRSDLVDRRGNRLEMFQFSQLSIGDSVADEALEAQEPSGSMISHLTLKNREMLPPASDAGPRVRWRLQWLPPGFGMAVADIRSKPSNVPVDSLMYTDGLATFTVFIEAMPAGGAASMSTQSGATIAITRGVPVGDQFYLATLVGEIPRATGYRIIESLVPGR